MNKRNGLVVFPEFHNVALLMVYAFTRQRFLYIYNLNHDDSLKFIEKGVF